MTEPQVHSAFHDILDEEPHQVSRVEVFTASLAGIPDGEHVDTSGDLGNRKVAINSAYRVSGQTFHTWVDESPLGSSTPTFGDTVRINFGLAGHALLYGIQVCFEVSASGMAAANGEWVPYLGERLMGSEYQVRYQSEAFQKMDMDGLHFRRRLEHDISTQQSESYLEMVGANSSARDGARTVWFPVDFHFNEKKPLVAIANSSEMELRFTLPSAAELVRAVDVNAADYDSATAAATISIDKIFLRCLYADVDQSSRFAHARNALSKTLRYHVSHIEKGESADIQVAAASAGDAVERFTIDIQSIVQPSAYLMAIVRYKSDLEAAASLSAASTPTRANWAANAAGQVFDANPVADRYSAIPAVSWAFVEKNQLVYPRMSWHYYSLHSHPQLFNSESYQPIAVISHCEHPMLARDHSTGHISYTNMNKPRVQLDIRKALRATDDPASTVLDQLDYVQRMTAANGAVAIPNTALADHATYSLPLQVDLYSVCYNFLYVKNGRIFYAYT